MGISGDNSNVDRLTHDDEERFIARSQRGDVEAFNHLVLHYQQVVYGVVLRTLGNRDTAEDVTQDAFLAAFKGIRSYRGGTSFRAWLLRVASNMACDHWRRTQRRPAESLDTLIEDDEPHTPSLLNSLIITGVEGNPEEMLLSRELQELIQQGLETLPLEQRVAVVLCDIEGLSYEEIAETTETTPGTVRSRISRGRRRMRNYLIAHQELLPRNYRLHKE